MVMTADQGFRRTTVGLVLLALVMMLTVNYAVVKHDPHVGLPIETETIVAADMWKPLIITGAVIVGIVAIAALATPVAPVVVAGFCKAALTTFAFGSGSAAAGYAGATVALVTSAYTVSQEWNR